MAHCTPRTAKFDRKLDGIDEQIAQLLLERRKHMQQCPKEYDCCGEGEVYFRLFPTLYAENVYHAICDVEGE